MSVSMSTSPRIYESILPLLPHCAPSCKPSESVKGDARIYLGGSAVVRGEHMIDYHTATSGEPRRARIRHKNELDCTFGEVPLSPLLLCPSTRGIFPWRCGGGVESQVLKLRRRNWIPSQAVREGFQRAVDLASKLANCNCDDRRAQAICGLLQPLRQDIRGNGGATASSNRAKPLATPALSVF